MNYLHIAFSLVNVISFIAIGSLIAYFVQKEWNKLKGVPVRKFIITATAAAFVGGLIGVLINGSSGVTNALNNMFIASLFALFAIAPFSFSNKNLT